MYSSRPASHRLQGCTETDRTTPAVLQIAVRALVRASAVASHRANAAAAAAADSPGKPTVTKSAAVARHQSSTAAQILRPGGDGPLPGPKRSPGPEGEPVEQRVKAAAAASSGTLTTLALPRRARLREPLVLGLPLEIAGARVERPVRYGLHRLTECVYRSRLRHVSSRVSPCTSRLASASRLAVGRKPLIPRWQGRLWRSGEAVFNFADQ